MTDFSTFFKSSQLQTLDFSITDLNSPHTFKNFNMNLLKNVYFKFLILMRLKHFRISLTIVSAIP